METFKDIIAWQKGYQLTLLIYKFTVQFPRCEEFGLKSELRRAAISYISNIAEGFKKRSKKESVHYYNRSECSLEEIKCQTMISYDQKYFSVTEYKKINELSEECGRVLNGWIKSQEPFMT
ncbi:four helix bundle protein [Patescibacteria group bacterium]|nr:four helix bundle protein [Patescibacteria group bacterium]MBU1683694.1 four helix bundle protein [Patescibacteria group bacterium]MBU1935457.1 four helix bundle protein [Patescibacteria group bacterium]